MESFLNNIFRFLTGELPPKGVNIIKKHHNNLDKTGDFSFPVNFNVWKSYLDSSTVKNEVNVLVYNFDLENGENVLYIQKKRVEELVEESQNWSLPLRKLEIIYGNCTLFLNREKCFKNEFLKEGSWYNADLKNISIEFDDDDKNLSNSNYDNLDVQEFRVKIVSEIVSNIVRLCSGLSKNNSESNPTDVKTIIVSSRNCSQVSEKCNRIKIGPVLDQETKKLSKLTYKEYLSKRSTDMQLISQHKYGLRVKNEEFFLNLISQLGQSAVIVDLVEAKATNPVVLIGKNPIPTGSKGVTFILYNSARTETLFRVYSEKVTNNYYPQFKFNATEMDFALLTEENEWKLFFNYYLELPILMEKIISNLIKFSDAGIHFICQFLYKLVGDFSIYYRRTKILTENRPHLLPVMEVRLLLLQRIRFVFNTLLSILNIKPVNKM